MPMSNDPQRHDRSKADVIVRYLTHPQVNIEPMKDVRNWSLNETRRARVAALASSDALTGTTRIISSTETKATQTAQPLADALGCWLEFREQMHENDRSATGYLPEHQFERFAEAFFARSDQRVGGWESARMAQQRIVREVGEVLRVHRGGDILLVGHGAVGTLLFCALADLPISRAYDQKNGGGNVFSFRTSECVPLSGWKPMESLIWPDEVAQTDTPIPNPICWPVS